MSKLKTPHQKKKASLAKDRRGASEAPKAARKSAPLKQARLNRAHRHAIHQSLHVGGVPVELVDADALDDAVGGLRRKQVERPPVVPLGDHIAERTAARVKRAGQRAGKRAKAPKT